MYSLGHMICFYMAIFGVIVEGLPRYRRQSSGQYAPQLTLEVLRSTKLNLAAQARGNSNGLNNFNITGQAEVNIPIYNGGPNNPSVDLNAVADVSFGSSNGQLFGPKPNYDVGTNINIPFGRR